MAGHFGSLRITTLVVVILLFPQVLAMLLTVIFFTSGDY
jgi:hypothetical protein